MPKDKLLDNINTRILRALQKNGHLHNNELAQEIGLSNSACLRRVNILEENEFIDRYVARGLSLWLVFRRRHPEKGALYLRDEAHPQYCRMSFDGRRL